MHIKYLLRCYWKSSALLLKLKQDQVHMTRLKQKLRAHNFGCFSHRLEYGWRNALISQNAYFSRTAPSEAQIAYFSRNTRSVASSRLPFEKYAFRWAKMRISREIRNPMSQIDCGSGITRDDKSSNVLQRPQSKSRAVCRRVRERRVGFSTCDTSRLKRVLASRGSLSRGLQYTFFLHTSRLKRVFALLSATKRYKNRQILILHKRRHAFHSNERQSEPSWPEPKCVAFEKYAIWPMCQKRRQTFNPRNTQSSFWRFSLLLIFTTNLPSRNQNIENLSCFINKKWRQDAKTL